MPCDNNNNDYLLVYQNILSTIAVICDKYNVEYVSISGDLNTDIARMKSQNTKSLHELVVNESLKYGLDHYKSDV